MSTDADGDSEMVSSPETGSLSGPQTPTKAQVHMANSGLSPPASQMTSQPAETGPATDPLTTNSEKRGEKAAAAEAKTQAPQAYQPGASWLNKRAEEEYQRAMEFVVDKDFSLQEFGDPFDDRDMMGPIL